MGAATMLHRNKYPSTAPAYMGKWPRAVERVVTCGKNVAIGVQTRSEGR